MIRGFSLPHRAQMVLGESERERERERGKEEVITVIEIIERQVQI